jgi:competence protein ComEA
VPAGARVATALELAGGPKPRADLTTTNLAAKVQDGQQVVVPMRGRPTAAVSSAAPSTAAGPAAGPLSLATATQAQLEELDGIGPALASSIIEYRDAHGGFRSVEELGEVDGIGEVRLEALRRAVRP